MIDISKKINMNRKAVAIGEITLKKDTIEKIKKGEIKKGDVFETAKIAGINAIKQTSLLIPHCHQIPIDFIDFSFDISDKKIIVKCQVKSFSKTGVEMEALVGVTIALNTVWDMVKYLEKDKDGQYPSTKISEVKILQKVKS